MHLLDTNVAIDLSDGDVDVVARIKALDDDLAISIISRVELDGGVYRERRYIANRRRRLDVLLSGLLTLPFEGRDADAYRSIVESTGFSRRKVLDRMIAAQALVRRATLITRNAADFRDVPDLELLEW